MYWLFFLSPILNKSDTITLFFLVVSFAATSVEFQFMSGPNIFIDFVGKYCRGKATICTEDIFLVGTHLINK